MKGIITTLLRYVNGLWVYRWWGILAAWLVCIVGWFGVLAMPDIYEAKARFYVDASSRLREVVRTLGMEPDVSSRVFLVRQAMLGRPQLEKVARATDIDLRASDAEEFEEVIMGLAERISIETGTRREAQNLFAIKYADSDRATALAVVNSLLNAFLDDVLQQKDTDTERTEEFLQEQLTYYRDLLDGTERKLEAFKREHAGFVVGDRGDYFQRMEQQETELKDMISQYEVELAKREELRRQLGKVNPYVASSDDSSDIPVVPGSETSNRINDLERQRSDLLLRVTDRHPDVRAIAEQINQLRDQLRRELKQNVNQDNLDGARYATNPVYVEIQIALSNTNLRVTELKNKTDQLRARLATLRGAVDSAPELERQFVQLTRDYSNYQNLYAEVLEKAERERIGRVGEEKDIITFNVIDPPAVSLEPVAPARGLLLFGVMLLGLGAAVGTALFLWQLKPTYSDEADLMTETGLPVIGAVSINFGLIGRSRRTHLLRFGIVAMALVATFGVVLVLSEPATSAIHSLVGVNG